MRRGFRRGLTAGLIAAAALAAPFLLPPAARSQPARELIAVMNLDAVGTTEVEASALSDRLREELLRTGRFTLIERQRLDAVLQEQSLQQAACSGQQCAVEAGRVLGVRKIVTGRATRLGPDSWQLSAQLVDVQTAETLRAESVLHEGRFLDLIQTGVPALAVKLAGADRPSALVAGGAVGPGEVEPPGPGSEPEPAEAPPERPSPSLRFWASPLTGFSQTLTLTLPSADAGGDSTTVTETFAGTGISLGFEGFVASEAVLWIDGHFGSITGWTIDTDGTKDTREEVDGSFSTVALGIDWMLPLGGFKMLLGGGLFSTSTEFEGLSPADGLTHKSDAKVGGILFQIRFDFTFSGGFMVGAGLDLGLGTATGSETEGADTSTGSIVHLYFPLGFSF
jgi:TolB-like protein